jgi:signal transduction histidine kinase
MAMKTLPKLILVMLINAYAVVASAATMAEGERMLKAAIATVVAKGPAAAAQEFNAGGKWRIDSTYIVMADFNGTVLAHSANAKMTGKVMLEAKDAAGKPFVRQGLQNIKTRGESLIDVKWGSPVTGRIADAQMLSRRIPGYEMYINVLIFR